MQTVLEIIIRVVEILTILAGSAGVCLSLVLLFFPGLILRANRALNRQVLTDSQLAALNPSVCSESFVLRHHAASGGFIVAGSIFILFFLFVNGRSPGSFGLFEDMAIDFIVLLGKTAGVVGLVSGTVLFFFSSAFRALGQKTNICIDTRPVFSKLDTVRVDVDSLIIRNSWVFGLAGLAVSAALIYISVVNFLGTSAHLSGRL